MASGHEGQPYVAVGRILKTYGLRGWVKLEALTTNPRRFRKGNTFILEGETAEERLVLEEAKEVQGALTAKFQGLENREQAAALVGKLLFVTARELGESPQDSFWEHQLLGLEVITMDGDRLGEVVEVMETGANDVLVVEGDREYLIPMIAEVVKEIDLDSGTIMVKPLPGLLED